MYESVDYLTRGRVECQSRYVPLLEIKMSGSLAVIEHRLLAPACTICMLCVTQTIILTPSFVTCTLPTPGFMGFTFVNFQRSNTVCLK